MNTTPKGPKTERGRNHRKGETAVYGCSTISFAEFRVSTQGIYLLVRSFIDLTFCGIFVCGPLQFKCQFVIIRLTKALRGPRVHSLVHKGKGRGPHSSIFGRQLHSIQLCIGLGKTFLRISRIRLFLSPESWRGSLYMYLLSFPRFWTLSIERF